jgi:hypothetical protein
MESRLCKDRDEDIEKSERDHSDVGALGDCTLIQILESENQNDCDHEELHADLGMVDHLDRTVVCVLDRIDDDHEDAGKKDEKSAMKRRLLDSERLLSEADNEATNEARHSDEVEHYQDVIERVHLLFSRISLSQLALGISEAAQA